MSSSLRSVAHIFAITPSVSKWLLDSDKYLAHTRKGKASEKFEEHVMLVNNYFQTLCAEHGLDLAIDKLILDLVQVNFTAESRSIVSEAIKEAFVYVAHFHDFGKTNENFQADPKKMNNPYFKVIPNHPLGSTHSALGAYLFIVKHFQSTSALKIPNGDLAKLHLIILLLSYPIFKHHGSALLEPVSADINFGEEIRAMKNYIRLYQFSIHPALAEKLPLTWRKNFFERFDKILKAEFPLFALIKLNFSLLTASDYLATHQYMSDDQTTDFGVFNRRERVEQMIQYLRQYKHNQLAFADVENFVFEHPTEKSNENLNRLRLEMAVELIQTIRQHTDKQLFYIEAPTGGGKTNLSMIALTELLDKNPEINKVYYVFPFTTLITQTYMALGEALDLTANELVQLHSKAGFQSKSTSQSDEEEHKDGVFGEEKKDFIDNLFALYPVTVLSHVKFFDILKTNRKETNYLLHRLANSVVVVDELQSYNPAIWDKMLFFISQYAEYFNVRFVLMSATLPKISELNIGLTNKPSFVDLLPNARKYLQNANFSQRVSFRFDLFDEEITPEALVEQVLEKSREYKANNQPQSSVHTIVEFIYKKSATAFHQLVQEYDHPFHEIFVLSGTILEPRRKYIINYLKNANNRSKNILLITTQVVEAGVDIDMDLGFKNISLIDSDEQLAGRVNRNASKPNCDVYLFRLDDAKVLYKADERYKVTQNTQLISRDAYQRILQEKDFKFLYEKVFGRINVINSKNFSDNFSQEILAEIQRLSYKEVDKNFKIIDQQNESVFVPLSLPVFVESSDPSGPLERIFSKEDLDLLIRMGACSAEDGLVDGKRVWEAYEYLIHNRPKGFDIKEKVKFKLLQSIMSKFTFSLISRAKDLEEMRLGFAEEKYGYIYFRYWNDQRTDGKPYSYEAGLNSAAFKDASFI